MICVLLFIVVVAVGGAFVQPFLQRVTGRTPGSESEQVAQCAPVAEVPPDEESATWAP